MNPSQVEQVMNIARQVGVLSPRDLDEYGLPRAYLHRLARQGRLIRIGRGLYMAPDAEITEHHSLVEANKRVPSGVICLLTALRFHDLTTQAPFEIWMALEHSAWQPRQNDLPLRFVRFSGVAFTAGRETYTLEGVTVNVYSAAKTIADCFKYRHKIGIDIAIEALRDGLHQRKCTVDELWGYAEICRVAKVMEPYLDAML